MVSAGKLAICLLVICLVDGHQLRVGHTTETLELQFDYKCFFCGIVANVLRTAYFQDKSQECLMGIVAELCATFRIQSTTMCQSFTTQYKDEVLYVIGQLLLKPNQLCGFLLQNCSTPFNPLNNTWTVPLPGDKPPVEPLREPTNNKTLRVLQLSDIHYDNFYQESSEASCDQFLCCRNWSGPLPAKNPAGKWGTVGYCDTPLRLLENLFEHLSTNETFDYILWTGDLPAHNVWNQTRSDQLSAYETIVKMFMKYFPNKPIYSALGNHESAPADSFPPHFTNLPKRFSISWLYDALAKHWTHWLPESTKHIIRNKASYMVKIFRHLRLISVNTNYCVTTNFWLYLNNTDPDGTLAWLVNQLHKAELIGDKVHIIGHVPSGDPTCMKQWSKNYYRIINRFENTVVAQFVGHTHTDQYAVFYENSNYSGRATNIMYVAPSVTTYNTYWPAYRIYTIDGNYANSTFRVLDHETYTVNITEANLLDKPEWKLLYTAKAAYNLTDLFPQTWSNLILTLLKDENLANTFMRNYYRAETTGCDRQCFLSVLCQLRSGRSHRSEKLCSDILPPNSTISNESGNNGNKLRWNWPFIPKECKSDQLPVSNVSNCKLIETDCQSRECGQICDAIVAAHSRMGRPEKLNDLRRAVCELSESCCCSFRPGSRDAQS